MTAVYTPVNFEGSASNLNLYSKGYTILKLWLLKNILSLCSLGPNFPWIGECHYFLTWNLKNNISYFFPRLTCMMLTLAVQNTITSHFDLHFNISSIHVGIKHLFMVYRTIELHVINQMRIQLVNYGYNLRVQWPPLGVG